MPYRVVTEVDGKNTSGNTTGGGPRIEFSNLDSTPQYLIVGSYGNVNNIDNGNRPLVIIANGGIKIVGLTAAPPGVHTSDLVIDDNGNVYHD